MWYLLQGSIIFAVCASNIHWHWTTNPYLAGGAGVALAWLATQAVADWQALRMRKRLRRKWAGVDGLEVNPHPVSLIRKVANSFLSHSRPLHP
jgi:hypothetical protein